MGNGLKIGKKGEFIATNKPDNFEIALLARSSGMEIMKHSFKKGEHAAIAPDENSDIFEYFYILEGKLLLILEDSSEVELVPNDYFYLQNMSASVQFIAQLDTEALYITSKPVFHYLSDFYAKLKVFAENCYIKDMYTHDHGERVGYYAIAICEELRLPAELTEKIGFAGFYHDLGKLNVPDEVLSKTSRLDLEEMAFIHKHPYDGAEIAKTFSYIDLSHIIEQHHERIDGTGYPLGLVGDAIHIGARIIAVADSFDAMTTDRPYKKGLDQQSALLELQSMIGSKYDGDIVQAFVKVIQNESQNERLKAALAK